MCSYYSTIVHLRVQLAQPLYLLLRYHHNTCCSFTSHRLRVSPSCSYGVSSSAARLACVPAELLLLHMCLLLIMIMMTKASEPVSLILLQRMCLLTYCFCSVCVCSCSVCACWHTVPAAYVLVTTGLLLLQCMCLLTCCFYSV